MSKGNSTKDTRDMVAWYADARIPVYLIVDPRDGTWTLYSMPRDGRYQGRLCGRYGEDVELPGLDLKIATTDFTRYA